MIELMGFEGWKIVIPILVGLIVVSINSLIIDYFNERYSG